MADDEMNIADLERLAELRSMFRYDPETGYLYRLPHHGRSERRIGQVDSHGHLQVKFRERMEMAHRICWELFYGMRPNKDLDHVNRIPNDNRICNLRLATRSQNNANCRVHRDNKLGVKGVRQRRNRFEVIIWNGKKCIYGGAFDTVEEASEAHAKLHKQFHGEFSGA